MATYSSQWGDYELHSRLSGFLFYSTQGDMSQNIKKCGNNNETI